MDYIFTTKPYNHQLKAFEKFKDRQYFGLFWEMGTGKTKTVLDIINYRKQNEITKKTLIVTPVTTIGNWKKEISMHTPNLTYSILLGNKNKRIDALRQKSDMYIINYDGINVLKKELEYNVTNEWNLVFDESTKIKHGNTNRGKISRKLAEQTRFVTVMTGTPITNNLMDIWNQMYVLDKGERFGTSFWYFRRGYFYSVDTNGWIWKPAKGTQEKISRALSEVGEVLKKKDCLDLPEKVYEKREVQMSPEQKKIYDKFAKDLIIKVGEREVKGITVLSELIKLHEIANGFVISSDADRVELDLESGKLNDLLGLLDEFFNTKVVIWVPYNYLVKQISKSIKDRQYWTLTDIKTREQNIDAFRTSENGILIANPSVGGFGINLTPCYTAIYFTNNYKVEERLQSEDRIHRPGQINKATIIDLVTPGTIDETIYKFLKAKRDIINEVLDVRKVIEGNGGGNNGTN